MRLTKKFISLLCIMTMLASVILTIPVMAASGDMTFYTVDWNGQEWELQTTENAAGEQVTVSYIDDAGNLNLEALATGYVYATYPPGVADANGTLQYTDPDNILIGMTGGDTDRNNDAFDINFRMKFKHRVEFYAAWYHGLVRLHFRNANTLIYQHGGSPDSYKVVNVEMGEDWHDWTIKVRGIHATVCMDGRELFSYQLFRRAAATRFIRFRTSYEYDYVAHTQIQNVEFIDKRGQEVILIQPEVWNTNPYEEIKYAPGQSITFEADTGAGDGVQNTVDFYANGVKIGSAIDQGVITTETESSESSGCDGSGTTTTTDPAHNAILTLENGLPAGKYYVKAKWGDKESSERVLLVRYDVAASVECAESATYGETVSFGTTYSGITPSTVEYFVDGQSKGTVNAGETLSVSDLSVGTHIVDAKLFLADGTAFDADEVQMNVFAASAVNDFNREYQLDYRVSGTGDVTVNDGYFKLSFSHTGAALTYRDASGSKTYSGVGDGEYKVVTTAGYAEVYYNGQLAFTYLMPYVGKSENSVDYSGGVSNVIIGSSGVKATRFHKDLDGSSNVEEYGMDFSKYYSLEFDKNDTSAETVMFYDGSYEAILEMNSNGITVNSQNKTSDPTTKVKISDNIPVGYYRVTVGEGMAQLFVNNVVVGTWRCPLNPHRKAILRKLSDPSSTTFVAIKNTDDVYYHSDDFEGNIEEGFTSEDYWYNEEEYFVLEEGASYGLTHTIEGDDADKYLELSGTGEYALNVNADNPTIRWKGIYEGTGSFEAQVRASRKYDSVAAVYDAATGTWDLKISMPMKATPEGETTAITMKKTADIVSDVSYPIDSGEHSYEIVVADNKLSFCIDGNIVIETDRLDEAFTLTETVNEVTTTYSISNDRKHGRFIFALNGGTLKIDDFEYIGDGKAAAGVSFAITDVNSEYYKNYKGQIVAAANDYANPIRISSDGGITWSTTYAATLNKGKLSTNTINLMSGKVLRIKSDLKDDVTTNSKYSYALLYDIGVDTEATRATSGGKIREYSSNRVMIEPDGSMDGVPYSSMGCRVMQITEGPYAGRVIYTRGGSGEEYGRVFMYYSDDYKDPDFEGDPVWYEPNVQFTYWNTGENVWESQCVEMPGGVVRCYVRSDKGFLTYFESYDGGATWDVNGRKTENLIAPSCCFSIQRMAGTSTYCAFWEYDTITSDLHYLEHPRNRAAFAISYDGMETWEYVADMEELGINVSSAKCNHSMRVIDNAAYMGYYMQGNTPGWSRSFRQDLTKVKPLKRFSELHYRTSSYMESQPDDQMTDYCVIPKASGEALIYGNYIYTDVNSNGLADANIIAKAVGATASISGTTVTLTFGNTTVTFTDGSTSYVMNGETIDAGYVLCEDGYLSPGTAEIFGKYVSESESSYVIHSGAAHEYILTEIEAVGASGTVEASRESSLIADINAASKHGSGVEIEAVLIEYSDILDLSSDSRAEVYNRMTGITYATVGDILTVFEKAVAAQNKAESISSGVALSTVSGGFDEWAKLGKNGGSVAVSEGVAVLSAVSSYNQSFVYGTPGLEIPGGGYNFTFDYSKASGDGAVKVKIGNTQNAVHFDVKSDKIVTYGAYGSAEVAITLADDEWHTFKGVVTEDEAGAYLTLYVNDAMVCENLLLSENIIRGFWTSVEDGNGADYKLRNVRVYEGKAIDLLSYTAEGGAISVVADFLNDGDMIAGYMFNEDFSPNINIDFNDNVKFQQSTKLTENYIVEVEAGAMHYYKSLNATEALEQRILLPTITDGDNPEDFVFEYDFMIPDSSVWTQQEGEADAFMYFDVFRNYSVNTLRHTVYIYKDRFKLGSTSFWFKNIVGTEDFGGVWMSFKHHYYYEDGVWKCDFSYKKQSDAEWTTAENVTMNTKAHTSNYIRFYAYPEDQVELYLDNIKVYGLGNAAPGGQLMAGVYNNGVQAGFGSTDAELDNLEAFSVKRITLDGIPYVIQDGIEPSIKLFMWKNIGNFVPMGKSTEIK